MSASTKILPVLPDTPTLVQRPLVAARELEQAAKLATVFQFRHIPELDGFRGIAILLVIAGHFGDFHGPTAEIRAYAKAVAELGVLLFFVLSGFLITGLLCRERIATGTVDLKQFYLRRVLRLAPALFLFLSTVMLLSNMGWITDVPKLEFLECLLYSRNLVGHSMSLGHIWSLSLEEQFYLVWPIAFLLLPIRRSATAVAAVCAGLMVWRGAAIAAHLFSYDKGIFYVRPYFRFDSILIGAVLALCICFSATNYGRMKAFAQSCWIGWTIAALAVWATFGETLSRPLYITVSEILVAAMLCQVIAAPKKRVAPLLRHPWLRYIGGISYSLYLWQELFVTQDAPSWGFLRTAPAALLLPLLVAVLSYHAMERPILKLKARLAPQAF